MLKKTITFTDYYDVERTEDFYFHITEAELIDLEMDSGVGFENYVNSVIRARDTKSLKDLFKKIVQMAYGVKSADGRRFMKSDEITRDFVETEAYNIIYTELVMDASKAADFIKGIMPKKIQEKANEMPEFNNMIKKP